MDPTECEILVHVTAPSGARDDKRYVSIAQAVLDFQPVSKVKVSETNFIFTSPASGAAQNPVDSRLGPYSTTRSPPLVPPEIPRPRTAPAATSSAENPEVSNTRTHRRARSQTSSSDRHGLSASNSPRRRSPCSSIIHHSQPGFFENGGIADHGHTRKRPRLTVPDNEQANIVNNSGPKSTDPTTPTKTGHAQSTTVRVGNGAGSPSVPSTVSPSQPLYWTKFAPAPAPRSPCTRAEPVVDLATPSRPNRANVPSNPGRQKSRDNDHGASRTATPKPGHHETQGYHGPSHAAPHRNTVSTRISSLISQLPDEIRGPNPKGGQARYKTHLTRTLQKLAVRVPLSKHFRPAFVARNVNVLERGFWQFSVQIVGDTTAAKRTSRVSADRTCANPPRSEKDSTRRLSADQTQATAQRSEKDSTRRIPADQIRAIAQWTEKDFIQFWHNVSRFVAEGKAGWGTALVKVPVEPADGDPVWKVRLFTWGEILGHIWLVLWVLSDKSTGRICMHWVAGDGAVVVKMSGARNGKRHNTSWVRKGPAKGEGGSWGISENFADT